MIAAPVDEQQTHDHERASEKPEVAAGSAEQPLEPFSDAFRRSEVGDSLDETNQAEYGEYIPF
jgi:hypothetical protein